MKTSSHLSRITFLILSASFLSTFSSRGQEGTAEKEAAKISDSKATQIIFSVNEIEIPRGEKPSALFHSEELGIAGVFTESQYQRVIRDLNATSETDSVSAPPQISISGQPSFVRIGDRFVGLKGTVDAEGYKIDVELFFQESGEKWESDSKILPNRPANAVLMVWDGQTIAYQIPIDQERQRVFLVTVQIADSVGQLLRSSSAIEPPDTKGILTIAANERLISYKIKKGDSLLRIAIRHNSTVSRIRKVNRMASNIVKQGDVIVIPEIITQ